MKYCRINHEQYQFYVHVSSRRNYIITGHIIIESLRKPIMYTVHVYHTFMIPYMYDMDCYFCKYRNSSFIPTFSGK